MKALEYEFKWKHDFFETFLNIFLNMISHLKIWFSRSYIVSLPFTLSLWEYDTEELFNVQFLPTARLNYQTD